MNAYKYLILVKTTSDSDALKVTEAIKVIAKYWLNGLGVNKNMAWLIELATYITPEEIRNKIIANFTNKGPSILVLRILTDNAAAAINDFAEEKTWNWIKDFCVSDAQNNVELPNASLKKNI